VEGWNSTISQLSRRIDRLEEKAERQIELATNRREQMSELRDAIRDELKSAFQAFDQRLDSIEKKETRNDTDERWRKKIGGYVIAVGSAIASGFITWVVTNWEKFKSIF